MTRTRCARRLTGAAALPVALLVAACSPASHSASPASHPASPVTAAARVPAAAGAAAERLCAGPSAPTFMHVTRVKPTVYGTLVLTGNPATLVCGGPDHGHYTIASTTETGYVIPGAAITVFPVKTMQAMTIAAGKLPPYLAKDEDTRIFLVTGPLRRISAIQEMSHG